MEENWKRILPALRGTGKSENSRAGIFPTGVASVAKVRSREWQKFRLGPRNNWFHRLERSREQLHRYRRVDDGAARIEDLEGTPLLFSYTVSVSLFLFLASTVSTAGGNVFHRVVKLLTTYLSRIRVARSWNHRFVDCRIKKYIT